MENIKKFFTYTLKGLGGVAVVFTIYVGYRWDKFRKKGVELVRPKFFRPNFAPAGWIPLYYRYKGCIVPLHFLLRLEDYENFHVRTEDVFLVTHPRSGTTWLQEIIFLIMSDLDFDTANRKIMDDRFPYLDLLYPGLKVIDRLPSPRLMKTHLPFRLLPKEVHQKKPKIIYSARNPKDVMVSHYYNLKFYTLNCSFEDAFDDFINARMPFNPWWDHVTEFWAHRHDENILFLKYEDLKEDLEGNIQKVANFLGKRLTDEEVKLIKRHCHIDNMRKSKTVNFEWHEKVNFYVPIDKSAPAWIRKGKIGDWRNHMTPEMNKGIDDIVAEKLRGTGLDFKDTE